MSDRAALKSDFLRHSGWDDAVRVLIAGDASNRTYERLTLGGETRILMDAPPQKGEDVRPFLSVTQILRYAGLSAPKIYAEDVSRGFLLIEDLGDDLFARVIAANPQLEQPLYKAAVDVLLHLHHSSAPNLVRFDAPAMSKATGLVFDWYQRATSGSANAAARDRFDAAFQSTLKPLDAVRPVLIQRDYHAENLIWLPDRQGLMRVGLLDYQDAVLGHPAYDLVSILQDARRDVSPDLQRAMIDRHIARSGADPDDFRNAYALLGLQRNLRILGVFTRLALDRGKPSYIDLIPRVWGHIETGLAQPAAAPIAPLILSELPAPTPAILQSLKDQCQSVPQPS
ncbi:MAG: phosphotransferase [Pseudomonadota bacterium]